MQWNTLTPKTKREKAPRVGRGGKRGKTSGRGTKGAGSRAGNKSRPEMRDIIKKLPKRRGFGKNRARTVVGSRVKPIAVTFTAINARFDAGAVVSPASLLEKGIVRRVSGKLPKVKVLATGELAKPVTIKGCELSAAARAAVEKAGGTIA